MIDTVSKVSGRAAVVEYLSCPLCGRARRTRNAVIPESFEREHALHVAVQEITAGPGRGKKKQGSGAFRWTRRPLTDEELVRLIEVLSRTADRLVDDLVDATVDLTGAGGDTYIAEAQAELDFRERRVRAARRKK